MMARAWITEGAMLLVMLMPLSAWSQNPCEEIGSDCRVMTAAERKGFEQRMAALQAALPVPDPNIYTRSSVESFVESMTTPAIEMMKQTESPMICRSWSAGCFPEDASHGFAYSRKQDVAKTKEESKDVVDLSQRMTREFENQVQVSAWLRPHPYLVANVDGKCVDVEDPTATAIEKTPTFLTYRTGDEQGATMVMVFGPRTCNEDDVLVVDKPAQSLAPVVSVEVDLTGPTTVILELAQKIDRQALVALLGPVVR